MGVYPLSICSTLLQISIKTLRFWLEEENIRPQVLRADRRIHYLTAEQLAYLSKVYDRPLLPQEEERAEKEQTVTHPQAFLTERLHQQEQRLEQVETSISQLQTVLAVMQEQLESLRRMMSLPSGTVQQIHQSLVPEPQPADDGRQSLQRIAKGRTKAAQGKGKGKLLPQSLILLRSFAEQHHISLKAADRASKSGKIAVVRGRWLVNSRYATEALGAQGQQDFYALFHTRESFVPCEHCPHQLETKQA